ncbi:MAG: aminopeptidase [Runella sp.]
MSIIKKIFGAIVGVLVLVGIYHHELVSYGYQQAKGQLRILWNTRPVSEVLIDPTFPDSLKTRLRLIAEIKQFAIDSLGLKDSDSYTTFYDQQGKPILWVITASEKYRLMAKEWSFPFIGTFAYKGFFDTLQLQKEEKQLIKEGYDTQISEVAAWSTLGFFKDPVLSSMLLRSEGSLANLIIHEMTHGTLFIKDNLELNENLASFVGDFGAIQFLKAKYGNDSPELETYLFRQRYHEAFGQHILRGARQLDSLYQSFSVLTPTREKEHLKKLMIEQIMAASDTLLGGQVGKKSPWRSTKLPNNAFFIGYLTYRAQQNQFQQEFEQKFKGDLKNYIRYLKNKYGQSGNVSI